MTAVGFLDRVHRQRTNGVNAEVFEILLGCGLFFPWNRNAWLTTHPLPPFSNVVNKENRCAVPTGLKILYRAYTQRFRAGLI